MSSFDDDKIMSLIHLKRIDISLDEDELLEPYPPRRTDIYPNHDDELEKNKLYVIKNECQIYIFILYVIKNEVYNVIM